MSKAARRAEFIQSFGRCRLIIGEDENQRWNFHKGEFPVGRSTELPPLDLPRSSMARYRNTDFQAKPRYTDAITPLQALQSMRVERLHDNSNFRSGVEICSDASMILRVVIFRVTTPRVTMTLRATSGQCLTTHASAEIAVRSNAKPVPNTTACPGHSLGKLLSVATDRFKMMSAS